jgi:hypothetical protein
MACTVHSEPRHKAAGSAYRAQTVTYLTTPSSALHALLCLHGRPHPATSHGSGRLVAASATAADAAPAQPGRPHPHPGTERQQ